MQLNPILALEVRARWRSNRSFLLLLGIALALSLVALFIYQRTVTQTGISSYDPSSGVVTPAISNFDLRFTAIGRELFVALAHANILLWLLLATASAATGIARERERGLLESLQLSQMSATGQIAARFAANLLLLGALQLVLLPIYCVPFIMGGVSQWEVLQAFGAVLGTSVVGTALGLWFSARSHRPTGALFGALAAIILVSGAVFYWVQDTIYWNSRTIIINWENLWPALLHPNALFWALTDATPKWTVPLGQLALSIGASWLLLTLLLSWSATRNVNRTLPPPSWQRSARWVEKLKVRQAAAPLRSTRGQQASGALLADIPLDRLVRFSDPLLSREVKGRFRLRQGNFWIGIVRGALFLGAVCGWIFELSWLSDAPSRLQMVPSALRIFLYGGTLALAAIAATSWTREREGGTWESLKLSLMPPRQILRAKWLSPLVSFAYYSAPLWILLPFGAPFVGEFQALMATVVVIAWLGLAVALGLWVSWRVKNGTASIAWTTGILALLLVGLPWLNSFVGIDEVLARAQYGVSGYENGYEFYNGFNGGARREDLQQQWEQEVKQKNIKPVTITFNASNGTRGSYPSYGYMDFSLWLDRLQARARDFQANLRSWHPDVAMTRIFGQSERSVERYSRASPEAPHTGETVFSFALSTLAPTLLTLVLLLLLRRDVKREQLNS